MIFSTEKHLQTTARWTGVLYLLLIPLGIIGMIYVPGTLIVADDPVSTMRNVQISPGILKLGIVAALITQVINIFVALGLYEILKPVGRRAAQLMVIFIFMGAPIAMLSEITRYAVLYLVSNPGFLLSFGVEKVQALVMFFLDLHERGVNIASIFWGLWLFPMGYLVYKSGFLPRFIGILLMIGCFGYLFDFFILTYQPDASFTMAQFTFIGELVLPLWLLFKGVQEENWRAWLPPTR